MDADVQRPVRCRLIEADQPTFRNSFNSKPFMFRHDLARSPLFELPRLALLAERMLAQGETQKFVALGGKKSAADTKFSGMPPQEKLAQTVRDLADAGAWLKISSANTANPEYGEVLQQILDDVETMAEVPLKQQITWATLTVFLASPNIVTPYHMDHESNFLFQIRGEKDLSLFDQTDRTLLSEDEIEQFYVGDFEAARYRTGSQERGYVYRLKPGLVVHHPPLAPHWVQNGNNVSVSVSIGFCMQSLDRRARVYQVNHLLRRMGLSPTPPGRSPLRDAVKVAGMGLFSKSEPRTIDEILFSGVNRIMAPPRAIKRALSSLRR
jgi:hypothetical protein